MKAFPELNDFVSTHYRPEAAFRDFVVYRHVGSPVRVVSRLGQTNRLGEAEFRPRNR